jgi:hypothetical protein
MKIIDLDGKSITVTNLQEAIAQADLFKHFQHEDPEFKNLDKKLNMYWSDILDKLTKLSKGKSRIDAKNRKPESCRPALENFEGSAGRQLGLW